ncbi:MAG TPA: polyprenyl synthetase family protein [Mariniphaga anaerophila]|uniref:Polyprenyl synthetase family protein n=1 Tax=Mariniphaga anaerophila TaxID=1484053 RepID=A0A831LV35_9BACT|nr:polyprenyl synthetase family protein [Mariniphaga anaerophila]
MNSAEELRKLVNKEFDRRLAQLNARTPKELYAPVNYSLGAGGKRLRPVLLLMSFNLFSDEIEKALSTAIAVEVFHNFTLLHDDIMDKAEVRRNNPTVHVKFSENNAILSGDAMAFLSYQYLTENRTPQLFDVVNLFTETALQVCEGQQYDMDFENRMDVTEEEYLEMIRLKTAVLLGCSLKAGALLAGTAGETAQRLYDFGINLGLAFQLQDDWLDTFGNQKDFGKKIGGDILANKKTWLLIKALEKASGQAKTSLNYWLNAKEYTEEEKINSIIAVYNELGIKALGEEKIKYYFNTSEKIMQDLPVSELRKASLQKFSRSMLGRSV